MLSPKKFIFGGYKIDTDKGIASFNYSIQSSKEIISFTDNIYFPKVNSKDIPKNIINSVLDNVMLVLGISYWKLYCPLEIDLGSIILNKKQAEFWNTVYTKGLGEFFYKNKIDFRNLVNFPYKEDNTKPNPFPRKNRSLLYIGGGKDSIVSGELLKEQDKNFDAFVVNEHMIRSDVIKILNANSINFSHKLDPQLLELNKKDDVYNGHVPVSAYYAFLGLLAGVLYDYRYLIVSNEESANYGNVEYLETMVNHQWSKSIEFENLFRDYVSSFISADLVYFSLLRPLKEIKITEVFTRYPQYFNVFSSCNRNFRINHKQEIKWCGDCPKCLFVFTMLSAFIPKEKLISIFGKNLYKDNNLLPFLKQLIGISEIKPFECVGTPDEMQYALYLASEKQEFTGATLMDFFEKNILSSLKPSTLNNLLSIGKTENIPEEFKEFFKKL